MRTVALAVAAGLVLAACGGDVTAGGSPDETATTGARAEPGGATTTTAPATEGVAETTATTEDHEGFTDLELVAPQLLIQAAELRVEGAEDLGYTPPPRPPGCATDLDAVHPADVHVGTTIAAGGVAIVEALRVFADADTASAAYAAWVGAAPSCRSVDAAATGPTDATEHVGADASMSFASSGGEDVLVLALLGDAIVSVRTTGTATAPDGSLLLPPLDVAAFAVGKLLAALEA